jgi:hypothetical protein
LLVVTSVEGRSVNLSGGIATTSMTHHTGDIAHEKEVGRVAPLSAEVIDFCQRNVIESHLAKAEEIATRLFPQVVRINIELEEDQEDGDQYLVLDVLANANEDDRTRLLRDAHRCG